MAGEIQVNAPTGVTCYAILLNAVGQFYYAVTPAFEAFNASHYTSYAITLTEQGTTGIYLGTMPVVTAGAYSIVAKQRAGGTPAQSDVTVGAGEVQWNGTALVAGLDAAGARTALGLASANLDSQLSALASATGAGGLATKVADAFTLVTGTLISGTISNTETDDDVYLITAPVTPAVGGFGLRQRFEFDLPLGRIPVSITVRGWWNGTGRVDVYALHASTAVYDQLTNSSTGMLNRSNELLYTIPLPRDYADSSGGVNNIVTLEFRATSITTANRLRIDQVLVAHVAEDQTITFPSAADIWTYPDRALTTPGVEPTTPLDAAGVRSAVGLGAANLDTQLANLDADVLTRLESGDYTAPLDAAGVRSAVGLSFPDLDTQLADLDSDVLTRLADADYTPPLSETETRAAVGLASANLDDQLADIATDVASVLDDTGTAGVVVDAGSKAGYALDSAGLDEVMVSVLPLTTALAKMAAMIVGKYRGAGTGVETATDLDGVTDAVVLVCDINGNRSSVTLP